ncbi:MAG TPA: general secretion pathway protein GspB [Gammaproteobacteria bacterium]
MSFILDALRKSESERQRDALPSIARIPSAVPQHGLPPWAIATMGALGLGVVLLAAAWISTLTGAPPSAESGVAATAPAAEHAPQGRVDAGSGGAPEAAAAHARVEPLPLPPPTVPSSARPDADAGSGASRDPVVPAPAPAEHTAGFTANAAQSALRGSPLAEAANRSQPASSPLAMAARSQTNATRPSPQTVGRVIDLPEVDPLPEPYNTVAPSLGLPELTLQLLAYDENDPSQQFAFINGARYAAGDTLPGGIRVIAINSRGVVLLARGRQLQLEAR